MGTPDDPIERAYRPPTEVAGPSPSPADSVLPDVRVVQLHLVVLAVAMGMVVTVTAMMQVELLDPAPEYFSARAYNELFTLHGVGSLLVLLPVLLGVLPMLVLPSQLGVRFPAWVAWPALGLWGVVAAPWWTASVGLVEPSREPWPYLLVTAAMGLHGVGLVLAVLGSGWAAFWRTPARCLGLVFGGAGAVAFVVLGLTLHVLGSPSIPPPELTDAVLPVIVVIMAGLVERHTGVAISGRWLGVTLALVLVGVWGGYAAQVSAPSEGLSMLVGMLGFALAAMLLYAIVRFGRMLGRATLDAVTVALALALVSFAGMVLLRRFLGTLSPDVHLHDTYFAVAPMHLAGTTALLLLVAACFQHAAALFGRTPRRTLGIAGALALGGGMLTSFGAMARLGQQGMPRRYSTYVPQFEGGFEWMGLGGALAVVGLVMVILAISTGRRVAG